MGCITCDKTKCITCDPAFGFIFFEFYEWIMLFSYLLFDETHGCSFTCESGKFVNEEKTKCITTCPHEISLDEKYCVASCSTGFF